MPAKSTTGTIKKKGGSTKGVSGYLPEIYEGFNKRYPEVSKAIDLVAETCQRSGPLNKKTIELIKLGLAIGINSEGAVRSHTRRALEAGISTKAIRQVVLLAFTSNGFSHTIAAYKWVEEVLARIADNQE